MKTKRIGKNAITAGGEPSVSYGAKPTDDEVVRINISLRGNPARWYREWKSRGLVKSTSDAVIQAFRLYQERLTEFDLKQAQLENLKRTSTDG
jgi:hypothetical protein